MPSLNQAEYLEEAIRSVLLQGYPNLEFVIRDGGSTDGSVDIIRKYEPWISHWVSQPDGGQSAAINAGFDETSGEAFNWLCSDDILYPGALRTVGEFFAVKPSIDVVCGSTWIDDRIVPASSSLFEADWYRIQRMPFRSSCPQQSCFWRRQVIRRPSLLDANLHYCMDYELWCYLLSQTKRWKTLPDTLAEFRMYGVNKTSDAGPAKLDELEEVYRRYRPQRIPLTRWYRRVLYPIDVWAARRPSPVRKRIKQLARGAFIVLLGPWYGVSLCRMISWPTYYAEQTGRRREGMA
jgi:glycosyltransferase involved in cell wall biosynthesis